MIKTLYNKAAGSMATEAYPLGTSQGDMRLRTQLDDVFIIRGSFVGNEDGGE